MNLPNKLTMMRILLIPVFILFASIHTWTPAYLIACIVFAVASFTDYLDGHIARKKNLVTDFGKFADPLADKILTTVALIYLMMDGVCHPIVLVIVIVREFAVSGVRMIASDSGTGKVIAANMWGKIKTVIQMLTIILYYLFVGVQQLIGSTSHVTLVIIWILCWVIAAATAISGIQYIWNNSEFINTAQ